MKKVNGVKKVTPDEKLIAARLMAAYQFPYFAAALFMLRPMKVNKFGTLATSQNGIMRWDPEFVESITIKELASVIVHELFHILFNHFERKKNKHADIMVMQEVNGKLIMTSLWNIAGDAEINDGLIESKLDLPKFAVTPASLREDGIEKAADNLLAEEYYDLLLENHKKNGGKVIYLPHPCGGCSGHQLPCEENDRDNPNGWSEAEKQLLIQQVANELQKYDKGNPGKLSNKLMLVVEGILGPPKIPWQQKLGRCLRKAVEDRLGTSADYSYRKLNRKNFSLDVILPSLLYYIPTVTVVIDTSGSMNNDRLVACLSEIGGIIKTCRAKINFIANDCDGISGITTVPCTTMKQVLSNLKGGGGTDFRPAFKFLEKQKVKPSLVVYLTDGEGPAPEKAPSMEVIWVIVDTGVAPAKWGRSIFIDTKK